MFSLLRDGDCDGRYQSRSEVVQALATMAVNQGYSQEWLLKVLLNPSNRAGEKIQRMGETEARRYIAQSYHKARAFVGNHPAFGDRSEAAAAVVEKIDRAADIILRSARPGQAGATDYSVLAVHLAIARRVGSLTYGASDREIAELAGLSRPTVTRSHRRLIENCKFLKRIKLPAIGATTASQWRLRLPAGSVLGDTSPTLIGGVRPTGKADHTPGADIWRRGKGLGKSKYRVWSLLTSPKTAAELATTLGIKVRSVWDHLWMLEDLGLCTRELDGKWHRCDVDLDAVANRLGVAGEGARQRARHESEREINAQRLRRRAEHILYSNGYERGAAVGVCARGPGEASLSPRQAPTATREMAPPKHRPLTPVSPLPCHENALLGGGSPPTIDSPVTIEIACIVPDARGPARDDGHLIMTTSTIKKKRRGCPALLEVSLNDWEGR
jgi:hypothetical protein